MIYTSLAYVLILSCVAYFCYEYCSNKNKNVIDANSGFYLSIPTCVAIKGIAAIIIVCHHYTLYRYEYVDHNWFTSLIALNGGNFALVLFLFLSGYGITKSELITPNTISSFTKKRIWKILRPCLIIYFITFICYSFLGFRNILETDIKTNHLNPFIIDISSHNFSLKLLMEWFFIKMDWYVYTTLVMYILFFASVLLFPKDKVLFRRMLFFTAIVAVYYLIMFLMLPHSFAHYYRNLWAFVLGVFVANKPTYFTSNKTMGIVIMGGGMLFNCIQEGKLYALTGFVAIIILSLLGYTNYKHDVNSKIFVVLGGLSYYLYLCHRMFYNIMWACDILYFPLFIIFSILFAYSYMRCTHIKWPGKNGLSAK